MPYFKREPLDLQSLVTHASQAKQANKTVATPLELVAASDALLARGRTEPQTASLPALVNSSIPKLAFAAPVSAGETTQRHIQVRNDEAQPVELLWSATDWIGDNGHVIPRDALSYGPAPLLLAPGTTQASLVSLQLPANTPRGTYCALLSARGLPGTQAVLSVEVV